MQIIEQHSLRDTNTFGFDVSARYFSAAQTPAEVIALLEFADQKNLPLLVLGEGSNVVLLDNLDALVLKLMISGVEVSDEDNDSVTLRIGAGENWHQLVMGCLAQGYFGLENLSLIPGSVGAAPVQNIGAYGVELKDVLCSVEAVDRRSRQRIILSSEACQFAYRDSIFKSAEKGRYIITHINLVLSKIATTNTHYGAIEKEIRALGLRVTPKTVSDAICRLRLEKLPDPAKVGNAGSFFKNPVITQVQFNELKQRFPEIVAYSDAPGAIKLAAAWLIEFCAWKGYRKGDIGVHAKQALVLVNYGAGQADELLALANSISKSVRETFGVTLEMEPTVYPDTTRVTRGVSD
jgi:UDP-N-acetylmuramate dehydrogenase